MTLLPPCFVEAACTPSCGLCHAADFKNVGSLTEVAFFHKASRTVLFTGAPAAAEPWPLALAGLRSCRRCSWIHVCCGTRVQSLAYTTGPRSAMCGD